MLIYAAQQEIEISTSEELINLLHGGNQANKRIIIKNDITIEAKDIPAIGSNAELTNCIVLGSEGRPTITVEGNGEMIRPLFGKILGNYDDVKKNGQEYPVLQNFNLVCNGDVSGAALCAELDSGVGDDLRSRDHLGLAKDISIKVNGNIFPYEYYRTSSKSYYKAGAFAIDWTEFDFYNINVEVSGNIGSEDVYNNGDVLVGGLFAENGGSKILRIENVNIKADKLIAKANSANSIAAAAGVAVTGESYKNGQVKVYGDNINVDVKDIISSNDACGGGKRNAFAALGFVDNNPSFLAGSTNMSISISIAPWNVVSNDVELGRIGEAELMSTNIVHFNDFNDNVVLLRQSNDTIQDPFKIKIGEIVGGSNGTVLQIYPQVKNSNFFADNIVVNSAGNCGAVYYGVGNIMNVSDTNIQVGNKISMTSNVPSLAGIAGGGSVVESQDTGKYPAETSRNNLDIKSIEVNPIDGGFSNSPAYISLIGYIANEADDNNITLDDMNININNDNLLEINLGLEKSYKFTNNDIFINHLNSNVLRQDKSKEEPGTIFNGFIYINKNEGMQVVNNSLAFDNDISIKSTGEIKFSGMLGSDSKGVCKDNTALFRNIKLKSDSLNVFSGIVGESSSSSNIENNSVQVLGNVELDKSKAGNQFSGMLYRDKENNSVLKDNTMLIMGSIINQGSDRDNNFTSLVLGYVNDNKGTALLSNGIYVHDRVENAENVKFSYLVENLDNGKGMIAAANNSVMLRDITEDLKDKVLFDGVASTAGQDNIFVHVNATNRDAYKITENGTLNKDEGNFIGRIKISPRDFQDELWSKTSADKNQSYDFDYIMDRAELGELEFISKDKDYLLNNSDGSSLSLNNFYRRHLAVKKDNNIYDILGIPSSGYKIIYDLNGGSLKDPTKPIVDENYYAEFDKAIIMSGDNAEKENSKFLGWSLDSNAKEAEYLPGDKIEIMGDTTLYAVWEEKQGEKDPDPNENTETPEKDKDRPSKRRERHESYNSEEIKTHIAYIFGYPDKTIRPEGNITRAEASALVIRLAELEANDNLGRFEDVETEAWYNKYINLAYEKDMLLAEDKNIRPNESITRAEFAKLIYSIDKENTKELPFTDTKGNQFEKEIKQAYANGRIEGYGDNTFRPDNYITRTEAVKILNSLFYRSADEDYIDNNQDKIKQFKDLDKSHWGYYELVEAANTHKYQRKEIGKIYEKWLEVLEYLGE